MLRSSTVKLYNKILDTYSQFKDDFTKNRFKCVTHTMISDFLTSQKDEENWFQPLQSLNQFVTSLFQRREELTFVSALLFTSLPEEIPTPPLSPRLSRAIDVAQSADSLGCSSGAAFGLGLDPPLDFGFFGGFPQPWD
ncbi:hypothetical protein ANN_19707 [Periplaneta americana]|uniref:Uncharacterized protein n=1 Tax=Periplaneta americana TaxID=6978 RepID=A0ABQ8SAM7_PERAM|nr:hypothetical protein ANN_19707 [Periplaneta americana]